MYYSKKTGKRSVTLFGGPFSQAKFPLSESLSGTLEFTLKSHKGHYDSLGRWVEPTPPKPKLPF